MCEFVLKLKLKQLLRKSVCLLIKAVDILVITIVNNLQRITVRHLLLLMNDNQKKLNCLRDLNSKL